MELRFAGTNVGHITEPFEHQGTWFGTFSADLQGPNHEEIAQFIEFSKDWVKRCEAGKAEAEEFEQYPGFLRPGKWSLEDESGCVRNIRTPTFLDGMSGEISWLEETEGLDHVYVLQHVRYDKEGDPWSEENIKMIGVYRSAAAATAAMERLRAMPGFRDYPNLIDPLTTDYASGFYLDAYELDQDHWSEGFGFG